MSSVVRIVIIFFAALQLAQADEPEVYSSIGKIRQTSDFFSGDATAFYLGDGQVLTNLHNLISCSFELGQENPWAPTPAIEGKDCPKGSITLIFKIAGGNTTVSVNEVRIRKIGSLAMSEGSPDLYRDFALLELDASLLSEIRGLRLSKDVAVGESIEIVGYPSGQVGDIVDSESGLSSTRGRIQDPGQVLFNWEQVYSALGLSDLDFNNLKSYVLKHFFADDSQLFHNAPIASGFSGSPVLNSRREVIGIVWGSLAVWNMKIGEHPGFEIFPDPTNPAHLPNTYAAALTVSWLLEQVPELTKHSQ